MKENPFEAEKLAIAYAKFWENSKTGKRMSLEEARAMAFADDYRRGLKAGREPQKEPEGPPRLSQGMNSPSGSTNI